LKVFRANALISGRDYVIPDDIKTFAVDALSHRIIISVEESLEGLKPRNIIEEIVNAIPAPTEFHPR